jgi:hypothetical protein
MNTEVFIYLIWFSFYGQFDLANEYLFYALDLSDNCGTRENPFKGYMTFQTGDSYITKISVFVDRDYLGYDNRVFYL